MIGRIGQGYRPGDRGGLRARCRPRRAPWLSQPGRIQRYRV